MDNETIVVIIMLATTNALTLIGYQNSRHTELLRKEIQVLRLRINALREEQRQMRIECRARGGVSVEEIAEQEGWNTDD